MAKGLLALVRPEMLIWARKSANMPLDLAAKKVSIPPNKLKLWEEGKANPTIRQARGLAKVYKRSLAVFYLSTPPPSRIPKVSDFRKLPESSLGIFSPELAFEIRQAVDRREIALELLEEAGKQAPVFDFTIRESDLITKTGLSVREKLGITRAKQSSWRSSEMAFTGWRNAIESLNVLVFQATDVSVKEMRGFSLAESHLPVIVVNRKDAPPAKIFSMLHELIHILLLSPGLCTPNENGNRTKSSTPRIEIICNRLAAEILIPQGEFLAEEQVNRIRLNLPWDDDDIRDLARRFNTSREAIVRRLLTFNLVNEAFYQAKRSEYLAEVKKRKKGSGFASQASLSISANGRPYTRLVVEAFYSRRISSHDVAGYLGIKLKHLKQISETVGIG